MKQMKLVVSCLACAALMFACDKGGSSDGDEAGAMVTGGGADGGGTAGGEGGGGLESNGGGGEGASEAGDGEGMNTGGAEDPGASDNGEDPGGDSETEEGGFSTEPDTSAGASTCDPWEQDCPDGEKCVPYVSDPMTQAWDANRCVPVKGDGVPGDACNTDLSDWSDTCDVDSVCWNLRPSEDGGVEGVCREFCAGSIDEPQCNEGTCVIANGGVINVCVDGCNPVIQECPDGQGCYFVPDTGFICHEVAVNPEVAEGKAGDPCGGINQCLPGGQCVAAEGIPGCPGGSIGCCSAFCATDESDPCPGLISGTSCVSLADQGVTDPAAEGIGLCLNASG